MYLVASITNKYKVHRAVAKIIIEKNKNVKHIEIWQSECTIKNDTLLRSQLCKWHKVLKNGREECQTWRSSMRYQTKRKLLQ